MHGTHVSYGFLKAKSAKWNVPVVRHTAIKAITVCTSQYTLEAMLVAKTSLSKHQILHFLDGPGFASINLNQKH